MNEVVTGIVGLLILVLVFLTGIELAFGMAVVGFVGFACLVDFSAACNLLVKDFFDTFTSYGFTVIPLFVLMGQVASNADIAKRVYLSAHKWVGHIPGGLAMTTVVGATLFKAMCGSTLATAATFSSIAIPESGPIWVRQEAFNRDCGFRRHPRNAYPSEHRTHHLRDCRAAIDRKIVPRRHCPRAAYLFLLHGRHIRVGEDRSGHSAGK